MKKKGEAGNQCFSFLVPQHLAENVIFKTLDIILTLSHIVERENMHSSSKNDLQVKISF